MKRYRFFKDERRKKDEINALNLFKYALVLIFIFLLCLINK
jgi:hypothetical protein